MKIANNYIPTYIQNYKFSKINKIKDEPNKSDVLEISDSAINKNKKFGKILNQIDEKFYQSEDIINKVLDEILKTII